MTVEEISQTIYTMILPFTVENMPPIAYISIEVGNDYESSNEQLTIAFNRRKWDTVLSTAELLILRKPRGIKKDETVFLGGFSFYNEDVDGKLDDAGIMPNFCFIGKKIA